MAEFRGNTNGERYGWVVPEKNPLTASQRGSSQLQFQPERRHRVYDEQLFGFPSQDFDLQTLESSLNRLSLFDSNVRHQQFPLPDNRWINRSPSFHNQGINGGGGGSGGGGGGNGYLFPPPREFESQQSNTQFQRLSYENNGGMFGYDIPSTSVRVNNGFLNGNSRDVSYLSRNRFLDEIPSDSTNERYMSEINNPWGRNNNYNPSIVSLAKDQVSSQQLQDNIIEASIETFDKIFYDLIFHFAELMVDPFGNQVVLKLIERCSSEQISQILDVVIHNQSQFVTICNDSLGYGTHAIQVLLRCLHTEEHIVLIVEAISMVAVTLAKNIHAKHVILECFIQFSPWYNRSLIQIISMNCYDIATDQHGCCMLQQCLSIGCDELKERLIDEIITNALRLCVNCYGNYVVQYLVELDQRDVTEDLIRTLIGNFAYLSRNKYGSHVVQKFLKITYIDSRLIVYDLLRDINTLLVDPFGNYVIQTAWFVSQDDMRRILRWYIKNHSPFLRCNKFGNKILEKLQI